jgi:hypothetical protein
VLTLVILVCGLITDPQTELLINSLNRKSADYIFIDEENLSDQIQTRWQISDKGLSGQIRAGKRVININEISGVYHRLENPEDIFESESGKIEKARSVLRALMDLFDILPARIINRRRSMMSNNSKPYQSLIIRQAGFKIPATLITNRNVSLEKFTRQYKKLIYKSTSSVRSIVSTLNEDATRNLSSLKYLPTQFQHKITGINVRVHTIGKTAIATQILTSATDYRYAQIQAATTEFKPYALTIDLRRKCLHLARLCGLDFAGIDLIISPDGVCCLEVNPSPGYAYYQKATGQPISDSLAAYLAREHSGKHS